MGVRMRRGWVRFFVPLVLVASVCVHARATGIVGDAIVHGDVVYQCRWWDTTCIWGEDGHIQALTYTGGEAANIVTFEHVDLHTEYFDVCVPDSPCVALLPEPDRFVFNEAWATLDATGLCRPITTNNAVCESPRDDHNSISPANALPSLPVNVVLGGQNDEFTAVITPDPRDVDPLGITTDVSPSVQEFAFTIDAGWGNDKVVLSDTHTHNWDGQDYISCGPGVDRVITNDDVTVAADCENVTRFPLP
jgi:hypothetical protein